tara:strand:- start:780 stop:1226 length:447 start_codon:yes stop_codon:yes gene_type:complete
MKIFAWLRLNSLDHMRLELILITSFAEAWKRAFDFKGKTTRRKFWYYILSSNLFVFLLNLAISFCSFFHELFRGLGAPWFATLPVDVLTAVFVFVVLIHFFGTFIVATSIFIRRLRDTGKSWFWFFVPLWNIYLCTKPTRKLITENNT